MSKFGNSSARLLLPFGLEYSDVLAGSDYSEKPLLALPVHGRLTGREEAVAMQNMLFAALVADGPFFTGSIGAACARKSAHARPADSRVALDGIPRYSDRYKKPKKMGATILDHPFCLDFFPAELYSLMGISQKRKKKLLSVSSFKANGGLPEYATSRESLADKLKSMAETLDENADETVENAEEEEDVDEEFDEDEDDDYNAERYFDDGDDDAGDAGDGDEPEF